MTTLFEILLELERDEIHMARLLILLKEFGGKWGKKSINGLTKLVKLDFLLRYPKFLEKAMKIKGQSSEPANIKEFEKKSVESKMVRFRYGPWDPRYRHFINSLVAKELAGVEMRGRTIHIMLTEKGVNLSEMLVENNAFLDMAERAKLLEKFFDISGTNLKNFIYNNFPEIESLRLWEEIKP